MILDLVKVFKSAKVIAKKRLQLVFHNSIFKHSFEKTEIVLWFKYRLHQSTQTWCLVLELVRTKSKKTVVRHSGESGLILTTKLFNDPEDMLFQQNGAQPMFDIITGNVIHHR